MRVWIVNQYALATSQGGGTRHFSLARQLVKRGHDVTIVASNVEYIRGAGGKVSGSTVEVIEGVRFIRVQTPRYRGNGVGRLLNMIAFSWQVTRLSLKHRKTPADVVVGSSPHLFAALAAAWMAESWNAPFVLEVRDLWPKSLVDVGGVSPYHPLVLVLGRIERAVYARADAIVTLLPGAAAHITATGGAADRLSWIPNGFDADAAKSIERQPVSDRPFTVMYAGAHGRANALNLVIDAAVILATRAPEIPIRFRLVGDGAEKASLMSRVRGLGLTNVVFEPLVPKAHIHATMGDADAFVLPIPDLPLYRYGVSPNKLFDYLGVGRPVILAAAIKDSPVENARAGVVVRPDGAAVADAVMRLQATSVEERWEMGRRGREYVLEHHDWAVLGAQLEDVLCKALRPLR